MAFQFATDICDLEWLHKLLVVKLTRMRFLRSGQSNPFFRNNFESISEHDSLSDNIFSVDSEFLSAEQLRFQKNMQLAVIGEERQF